MEPFINRPVLFILLFKRPRPLLGRPDEGFSIVFIPIKRPPRFLFVVHVLSIVVI